MNATPEIADLLARLTQPFEPAQVKFRPGATSGNRALAIPYVDVRVIMDRLDEVLGVLNWTDDYEFLADGSVICRLKIRIGGEWIQKVDVGGQSEQPDEGDRRKAAVSDSLKRAAVKLGVSRYLYRLPATWVDYDPAKKQLKSRPALPSPDAVKASKKPAPKDAEDTVVEGEPAPKGKGRTLSKAYMAAYKALCQAPTKEKLESYRASYSSRADFSPEDVRDLDELYNTRLQSLVSPATATAGAK